MPVAERGDLVASPTLVHRPAWRAPRMPHLAGLDGVRAIAVSAVVLYHLDLPWMPGGFLGVDVFFVLSGFLITTLVLEEVEHTGRLDYRQFYLRRARRLLPALWLLLLTVSSTALVFFREELVELRGDVAAALLYVSNWWYVVADQSYFEFTGRPPVLQHLWSLAVEEQFYLLWPVVVVAAMASGRRRVRRVAMALALLSTAWMVWLAVGAGMPVPTDPSRVYYGTDTHAMGLLLGAALATAWAPWRRWAPDRAWASRSYVDRRGAVAITDVVGLAALVGLVGFFLAVGEFSAFLYRGGFLVLAAVTALVIAAASHPAGLLGRALALQPLRYLGERSYGIYLWHWPVFMVTRPGFELGFGGWPSAALRVGLTLLLAEASYRFVEMPIRRGALARQLRRAREQTPQGRKTAVSVVVVTLAAAIAVWTVGSGLYGAGATSTSTDAVAESIAPQASSERDEQSLGAASAATPTPSPTASAPATPAAPTEQPATAAPGEEPEAPADPGNAVSAFGDSVMLGAAESLREAGASVAADTGWSHADVADAVRAAQNKGLLRDVVVLHVGSNGPVPERDLRALLDGIAEREVLVVTVNVPRSWERFNNDLFARVADDYANVRLADWKATARQNPSWLYDDGIHLVPSAGYEGYTAWLLDQVAGLRR